MSIIGTKAIEAVWTVLTDAVLAAAVDLGGFSVDRILMPATWTAADLTFQVSDDGGTTYRNLYWDWGAEMVVDAVASAAIELSPFVRLNRIDHLIVRSGTSGVTVNQGADTTVILSVSARG